MNVAAALQSIAEGRARVAAVLAAASARARVLLEKQLHIATRLVEAGREVVGAAWREAEAPRPWDPDAFAAGWPRLWRAMRLAVLLRERLLAELKKPPAAAGKDAGRAQDLDDLEDLEDLEDEFDDFESELEEFERELRAERLEYERGESFTRRPADRLKRYVMAQPVEALFEEIREGFGFAPDWLRQAEADWAHAQASDLAPLGEAPREAGARGPTGSAPPPPSSASPTLPPQGEDPVSQRKDPPLADSG